MLAPCVAPITAKGNTMYRHARSAMLTVGYDYQLTPEDIKAWQHNWTASMRASRKLSEIGIAGKFKKRF